MVFHVERLSEALGEAKRLLAPEAAILSTCNRTELYLSGELDEEKRGAAAEWLAGYHKVSPGELSRYLYTLPREQAVRHAFRVASGLDSMVPRAEISAR
jgi:glutamyl-tRNA reductase